MDPWDSGLPPAWSRKAASSRSGNGADSVMVSNKAVAASSSNGVSQRLVAAGPSIADAGE